MAEQVHGPNGRNGQSPALRWMTRRGMAAVALASVVLAGLPAAAAAGATHARAASAVPRAVHDAGLVTLATGERVVLGPQTTDRSPLRVIPATRTGPAASLETLRVGGDRYVIPGSARHYLGRYLDPSLFDVDRIAAAHLGDRLPVRLRYTGATPTLPGVTVTSAASGVATGYLTSASARTFGRALARQAVADANAGWPATSALFAGVTNLAADVPASPILRPAFPMVTLIIHAVAHDGLPLSDAFGILINVDDARKFGGFFILVDGEARVSVPLGTYAGATEEDIFSDDGAITSRIALAVDYPVTAHLQTLTFDTRLATVSPSVTAPRPAVAADLELEVDITDAAGFGGFGFGFGIPPDQGQVLLPPTAPPAIGTLTQSTAWTLVDPSTAGGRYTYGSAYVLNGIPARQRHRIPSTGLESVRATYHADRAVRVGAAIRLPLLPGSLGAGAFFLPLPMPLQRTEFLDYPAGTLVLDAAVQDWTAFDPGIMDAAPYLVDPGGTRTTGWFADPFTTQVPESDPTDPAPVCWACRTATDLLVLLVPTDNVRTHSAEVFASESGEPVARFQLFRDGVSIFDQPDYVGAEVTVPEAPATYRAIEDLDRAGTASVLSTSLQTDVTFRSAATDPALPPTWFCLVGDTCSALPILRAEVHLPATLSGRVSVGRSRIALSVEHIAGAPNPAVTSVTVEIRRTGTDAWTELPVTRLGHGRYRAALTLTADQAGHVFDTRVSATDTAGGVLHQTTIRAFVVTG